MQCTCLKRATSVRYKSSNFIVVVGVNNDVAMKTIPNFGWIIGKVFHTYNNIIIMENINSNTLLCTTIKTITTATSNNNNKLIKKMISSRMNFTTSTEQSSNSNSTSNSNSNSINNNERKVHRKRHNFRGGTTTLDNIPSLKEFQQQLQVRNLFRQFLRLVLERSRSSTGSRDTNREEEQGRIEYSRRTELKEQIKKEFRCLSQQSDTWNIKRALSEGNRRYKELATMLGTSVDTKNDDEKKTKPHLAQVVALSHKSHTSSSTSTGSQVWPWDRDNTTTNDNGPMPFPKKSGM